jgi:hypothetical protein
MGQKKTEGEKAHEARENFRKERELRESRRPQQTAEHARLMAEAKEKYDEMMKKEPKKRRNQNMGGRVVIPVEKNKE